MIIPSVLTSNKRVAQERIELAKKMSGWLHLDFLDHSLYLFESLTPDDFKDIDFGEVIIEAHCMTNFPLALLESDLPIERFVIHHELKTWQKDYDALIAKEREVWLAIDPSTDVIELELPKDLIGIVLMGVEPGQTGQPFIPETYERLEQLKDRYPDVAVTVDGGVGPDNLRLLLAHGADNFVMGNAIWHQSDPLAAYERYVTLADPIAGAKL